MANKKIDIFDRLEPPKAWLFWNPDIVSYLWQHPIYRHFYLRKRRSLKIRWLQYFAYGILGGFLVAAILRMLFANSIGRDSFLIYGLMPQFTFLSIIAFLRLTAVVLVRYPSQVWILTGSGNYSPLMACPLSDDEIFMAFFESLKSAGKESLYLTFMIAMGLVPGTFIVMLVFHEIDQISNLAAGEGILLLLLWIILILFNTATNLAFVFGSIYPPPTSVPTCLFLFFLVVIPLTIILSITGSAALFLVPGGLGMINLILNEQARINFCRGRVGVRK